MLEARGVRSVQRRRPATAASSRRAVPLSRSPSVESAVPRFICVIAQPSGTRWAPHDDVLQDHIVQENTLVLWAARDCDRRLTGATSRNL